MPITLLDKSSWTASRGVRAMLVFALTSFATAPFQAEASPPFRFESVTSLDDMKALIRRDDPVGTPRSAIRASFVNQGGGTLKVHPLWPGVEKYLYDINLCRYYVWRWNISADYDASGGVRQIYVNGEPALPDGAQPPPPPKPDPHRQARILKITRPRPQADKGETSLAAIVLDREGDGRDPTNEDLIGAGPTRSDPTNMGALHVYHVQPWRSIFDEDAADLIVPFAGDCAAADAAAAKARANATH